MKTLDELNREAEASAARVTALETENAMLRTQVTDGTTALTSMTTERDRFKTASEASGAEVATLKTENATLKAADQDVARRAAELARRAGITAGLTQTPPAAQTPPKPKTWTEKALEARAAAAKAATAAAN